MLGLTHLFASGSIDAGGRVIVEVGRVSLFHFTCGRILLGC